jgi:hypothetical protein
MTVLREAIEVPVALEAAFDAVADFSSAEGWDPGVVTAARVGEGAESPCGVGARYELTVTFNGRESRMTYITTAYVRPTKVVLEGDGPKITATDTIGFEPTADGGTRITYEADLRLKGLARAATPLLKRSFDQMGKRALAGMETWFAQRA